MRKGKELLWFLLPFLGLPFISFGVSFLIAWVYIEEVAPLWETVFASFAPEVLPDLLISLLQPVFTGVIYGGVLGIVLLLLRGRVSLSRRWWYVLVFGVAALLSLAVWVSQMRIFPGIYTWLYFLWVGNIAAFFVWLVELVWRSIKKPKQEVKAE